MGWNERRRRRPRHGVLHDGFEDFAKVHERGFPFLVETGAGAAGGGVFVGGGMVSLVLVRLLHVSEGRDAMHFVCFFLFLLLGFWTT